MSRHRRVVWSEGMLLSPQHLQQWERHAHHAADQRLRALQPFASGFTELKLDRDQLRNGRFGILEAHAGRVVVVGELDRLGAVPGTG